MELALSSKTTFQRQLKYRREQQGSRLMNTVDHANLHREVELKVGHQVSDIKGKLVIQVERLCYQEAAQKIRDVLRTEICNSAVSASDSSEQRCPHLNSHRTTLAWPRLSNDQRCLDLCLYWTALHQLLAC